MNGKEKSATSKEKGEVVERVVAMMHQEPGVEIRRDVQLPARNNSKRSRQIDVLLLGHFDGNPKMLAIECKNHKRPIDVGDIGRFRDLLDDVGLTPQQGILISASRIGAGALDRANELGMRAYELSGLTPDRLSVAIHEASQLVVIMVPAMSHLSIVNEVSGPADIDELMTLFDADGKVVAHIPDLLWLKWLGGEPPSVLGEHHLELEVPEGWHTRVRGQRKPVLSASAKVAVNGAVVALQGTASSFALVDPNDQGVQKFHSTASFENTSREYPVFNFEEESQLGEFIEGQRAAVKVTVGRVRTPRIRMNHIYWPPSERVMHRVRQYKKFHEAGRIGMPRPEDLKGVEGNNLRTLWEPIANSYPALELLHREND